MENKEILTAENEQENSRRQALEVLKSSYEMYERSKNETLEERRKKTDRDGNPIYSEQSTKETLELIDAAQEDVVAQFLQLGGDITELEAIKKRKNRIDRKHIAQAIADMERKKERSSRIKDLQEKKDAISSKKEDEPKNNEQENDFSIVYDEQLPFKSATEQAVPVIDIPEPTAINEKDASTYNAATPKANYDTVALPSKGECYKNKVGEIKVSHLVAYDENLILSPSLYKNGTFLDHILKNKILDDINPDDLIQGDRDAIIIWLRAGGYGSEYPIRITDDKTGQEYETTVDLSALKFKKFTLKGDENGYFDFTLPASKDAIKFRFLTNKDVKRLEKMRQEEEVSENLAKIKDYIREIRTFIDDSDKFDEEEAKVALDGLSIAEEQIYDKYKEVPETYFTHDLTNRLIMSTVSVNGITDRKYVSNYIANMNLKDASAYRKYIIENEPGVDYNIKVKRPDSLGGGYVDTFLQLDQFIFVY